MGKFLCGRVSIHQYDDDDNSSGVVDDNFTCEWINTSNTRSNSSLASSSNDLNGGSRRPLKKRIVTHGFVWKHFEKVKDSNGNELVICKLKKNPKYYYYYYYKEIFDQLVVD